METQTITEQLKILIRTNGPEVLSDSGKINGILADLFPKAEKERSAIRSALRAGAGRMFYELSVAPSANQPVMLQNIKRKLSEEAWLSNQACDYVCTVFLRALGIIVPEQAGNAANNARIRETEEVRKAAEDKARAEAEAELRKAAQTQAETEAKAAKAKTDERTKKEKRTGGCLLLFLVFMMIFYARIKDDRLIAAFRVYTMYSEGVESVTVNGVTSTLRWVPFAVVQGVCVAAGVLFSVIGAVKPGKTVKWLILLATVGLIAASVAEALIDPSVLIGEENPVNSLRAFYICLFNAVPVCMVCDIYGDIKKHNV